MDCARLPREEMFVALPRKVDTMLPCSAERTLPRANLARVEPSRSGSLSRGKETSIETVLWRSGVFLTAQEQRRSTAASGRRASMLDMNTVNKLKNLPRTNNCAQQQRACDIQPNTTKVKELDVLPLEIFFTRRTETS
jgi:hypothetical protein